MINRELRKPRYTGKRGDDRLPYPQFFFWLFVVMAVGCAIAILIHPSGIFLYLIGIPVCAKHALDISKQMEREKASQVAVAPPAESPDATPDQTDRDDAPSGHVGGGTIFAAGAVRLE